MTRLFLATLSVTAVVTTASAADPPGTASGSTTPTTGRARLPAAGTHARPSDRRPAPTEFRFDALRFGGQLTGPHALIAHGRRPGSRPSLLSLRRAFVHRVFETVEAPALANSP